MTNHHIPVIAVITEKAWQGAIDIDAAAAAAAGAGASAIVGPDIVTWTSSEVRQDFAGATKAAAAGAHVHITYHNHLDRIVMVPHEWAHRHGLVPAVKAPVRKKAKPETKRKAAPKAHSEANAVAGRRPAHASPR